MVAKVLDNHVDWLSIAFRVRLDEEVSRALADARARALRHGEAAYERHGWHAELRAKGQGKACLLTTPDVRVLVEPGAPGGVELVGSEEPGWTVVVEATNDTLLSERPNDVGDRLCRAARMFGEVLEARVRRLDLAVDVEGAGVDYRRLPERIVKRSQAKIVPFRTMGDQDRRIAATRVRTTYGGEDIEELAGAEWEGDSVVHALGRADEGIQVAPGAVVHMRGYDKTRERRMKRIRGDVVGWRGAEGRLEAGGHLEARWFAGGWDGVSRVDRFEFQLRTRAIQELRLDVKGASGLDLERELPAAWRYLVGGTMRGEGGQELGQVDGWIRVVDGRASRLTRSEVVPFWKRIREASWSRAPERRLHRQKIRRGALAAQTLGCAVSLLGRRLELRRLEFRGKDGAPIPANMVEVHGPKKLGPELARATLRRAVGAVLRDAVDAIVDELTDGVNPADQVERFVVRYRAAWARWTPNEEREALALGA